MVVIARVAQPGTLPEAVSGLLPPLRCKTTPPPPALPVLLKAITRPGSEGLCERRSCPWKYTASAAFPDLTTPWEKQGSGLVLAPACGKQIIQACNRSTLDGGGSGGGSDRPGVKGTLHPLWPLTICCWCNLHQLVSRMRQPCVYL